MKQNPRQQKQHQTCQIKTNRQLFYSKENNQFVIGEKFLQSTNFINGKYPKYTRKTPNKNINSCIVKCTKDTDF